jgi:thioredoxin-dependent peroxiredoxin
MAQLKEKEAAPEFSTVDHNGAQIKLSDYRGKKVILYFYPADDTPGCTAEACNLRDNFKNLTDKGFVVLGISPDTGGSHNKFIAKYNLPFPLIPDPDKLLLNKYEAWGEKNMYGKKVTGVLRKTYIIDEEGKIEKIIKKVDTKNHSEQILRLLSK